MAIEQQKLFKRWEWLMEQRTYPSGRLNQATIAEVRKRIGGRQTADGERCTAIGEYHVLATKKVRMQCRGESKDLVRE